MLKNNLKFLFLLIFFSSLIFSAAENCDCNFVVKRYNAHDLTDLTVRLHSAILSYELSPERSLSVILKLLEDGADPFAKNMCGESVFDAAKRHGLHDLINAIEAFINIKNHA